MARIAKGKISALQGITKPNKTTMTKFILNIILMLLLFVAVCGSLAWLLPVKVSVTLLFLLQLLTLIILGTLIKRKDDGKES